MIYFAENRFFRLGVNDTGAELHSLCSKKTGRDYIWSGDPSIWNGQSPILFPIIGRLLNDKYRLNGKEYTMPKHGVARHRPFVLFEKKEDSLTFLQTDTEESLKLYPFHYELYAAYRLTENGLKTELRVVNTNQSEMLFSLGAHPGFACELGDKLVLTHPVTLRTERINEESVLLDETFPLLDNSDTITVTKDIFNHDALILSGLKDHEIFLKNKAYTVDFKYDAPVLGIWAKPGAPYVCLEPWYGIDDDAHEKADFSEKRGIMKLAPGEEFTLNWSATIFE